MPLLQAAGGSDRLTLDLPGASAWLLPHFLDSPTADALLHTLRSEVPWRQDVLRFGGRSVAVPRLQAWYGDPGTAYRYSGLRLDPLPWHPALLRLKQELDKLAQQPFNSVLLNYYRDGRDSVAWHSDDEPELGPDPYIASLSLGATRRFDLRHRQDRQLRRRFELRHGALLLMGPGVQQAWQHQLPKQPAVDAPRLNLTFRRIIIESQTR